MRPLPTSPGRASAGRLHRLSACAGEHRSSVISLRKSPRASTPRLAIENENRRGAARRASALLLFRVSRRASRSGAGRRGAREREERLLPAARVCLGPCAAACRVRALAATGRAMLSGAAAAAGGAPGPPPEVGRLVDSSHADDRKMIRLVRERRLLYARNNMPVASFYAQVKRLWEEVAAEMNWTAASTRADTSRERSPRSYTRALTPPARDRPRGPGTYVLEFILELN
ncbi:hypothetical protein EVAR_86946_1 [Eumeta japonica]|uniref:MADF domain-containing protein n=1 Tax=Eumeta variegata TaxID=151549 RepID=A0A4C1W6P9_EUMVA|nr:hypothetical protein EVAR_86946_1 [Eumeta japonica]